MHLSELDKGDRVDLASAIAAALHVELGGSRALVKTVMRWTGASPRAVKQWLVGNAVPDDLHLKLAKNLFTVAESASLRQESYLFHHFT
jgi:hypothetical protein